MIYADRRKNEQPNTILVKRVLLWQFYVAINNTTYLRPHVSVQYFCPILRKFGFSLTDFLRSPQYKILQKSMQLEPH